MSCHPPLDGYCSSAFLHRDILNQVGHFFSLEPRFTQDIIKKHYSTLDLSTVTTGEEFIQGFKLEDVAYSIHLREGLG